MPNKRCRHQEAEVIFQDGERMDARCSHCGQGWHGTKLPWVSNRGKVHRPPRWVSRLITAQASDGK